jgi:flagellar hook-basal body complex protein FliE
MTKLSDHQAAAALLNQAIHAVNDVWLEANEVSRPLLTEAENKLHEAQSLMLTARMKDEEPD